MGVAVFAFTLSWNEFLYALVFIGSDSQLIAPVTIGKGAYVGSGSTIRENVPAGALAVSAGKQRNIEEWVEKKKKRRD